MARHGHPTNGRGHGFARGELHAARASVEQLAVEDEEDGDDVYAFVRGEVAGAMMPGPTLIGRVRLSGTGLTLETNCLRRADRLRRRLEAACGDSFEPV